MGSMRLDRNHEPPELPRTSRREQGLVRHTPADPPLLRGLIHGLSRGLMCGLLFVFRLADLRLDVWRRLGTILGRI